MPIQWIMMWWRGLEPTPRAQDDVLAHPALGLQVGRVVGAVDAVLDQAEQRRVVLRAL